MGSIVFEIYDTKAENVDSFIQEVINAIDSERKTLWNLNVRFVNLNGMTQDHFMRDKVKVHLRSAEFTFQYSFTHGLYS
jgi:hypothetical protein